MAMNSQTASQPPGRFRGVRAALLLAGLTAACGGSEAAGDEMAATVRIGAAIPLTGRYAAGGDQVRNGYILAVEAINESGGVEVAGKKRPIELIMLDDESNPERTVQRMATMRSHDNVIAYLGGFGSDLHAAAVPIAEGYQIP
jgi:branched-chain amino acid transport system substrate-binding protein